MGNNPKRWYPTGTERPSEAATVQRDQIQPEEDAPAQPAMADQERGPEWDCPRPQHPSLTTSLAV